MSRAGWSVMAPTVWEVVAASVREIERSAKLGHRGVLFTGEPQRFAMPLLGDRHWDPLYAAAQMPACDQLSHRSGNFEEDFSPERLATHGIARPWCEARCRSFSTTGSSSSISCSRACCRASLASLRVGGKRHRRHSVRARSRGLRLRAGLCAPRAAESSSSCRAITSGARSTAATSSRSRAEAADRSIGADNVLFETDYPTRSACTATCAPRSTRLEDSRRRCAGSSSSRTPRVSTECPRPIAPGRRHERTLRMKRSARGRARDRASPASGACRLRRSSSPTWAPRSCASIASPTFRESGAPAHKLLDRGRRSIAVDLKHPQASRPCFVSPRAPRCSSSPFRPGVAERLGVGRTRFSRRNERIVYGRLTGWGQEGPLARMCAHSLNYEALTVHPPIGPRGGAPVPLLQILGDFAGGAFSLPYGVCARLLDETLRARAGDRRGDD